MAAELRRHWADVFRAKSISAAKLDEWLDDDEDNKPCSDLFNVSPSQFKLKKRNIKHAIKYSNNSSPGPDGIPFGAWRRCIKLSTEVLFDAVQPLLREDGTEALAHEWENFNHSLLFFLPKKASGKTSSGEGYYESENVRPLNVTNTDNRLLANAIKHRIEPSSVPRSFGPERVSFRADLCSRISLT